LTDNRAEIGLNGVVTSLHFWVVQETEISQWEFEAGDVFSKLTFRMNKTFKTWGKPLQLPYANEVQF